MPKKEKIIYKKRAFLNDDPSMSGFVIALLEEFNYREETGTVASYPTLDLGDCSQKISLDFSFYQTSEMKKAQKKLHLLKSIIDGFTAAFDSEVERVQKGIEKNRDKVKIKAKKQKSLKQMIVEGKLNVEST